VLEQHPAPLAELKLPAVAEFISEARRVAVSLGSRLGFTLEEVDELSIAVTQACHSTIETAEDVWGRGATLKLTYSSTGKGMAVEVEALAPGAPQALHRAAAVPIQRRSRPHPDLAVQRALTQEMMRLFVDDLEFSAADREANRIRFRMVKYLIS